MSGYRPAFDSDSDGSDSEGFETGFSGDELSVRLQSIASAISNLYRIAMMIRNQKTRRSIPNKLRDYERRDPETGLDLFEDGFRTFDRHHICRKLSDMRRTNSSVQIEPCDQYEELVDRLTAANILRRKLFRHWERHAEKLGQVAKPQTIEPSEKKDTPTKPGREATRIEEKSKKASVLSPTEVTQTHREQVVQRGHEANIETGSAASFASTIKDVEGHEASLPDPPRMIQEGHLFKCPYCFVLCTPKEASRRPWRYVNGGKLTHYVLLIGVCLGSTFSKIYAITFVLILCVLLVIPCLVPEQSGCTTRRHRIAASGNVVTIRQTHTRPRLTSESTWRSCTKIWMKRQLKA